MAKTQKKRPKVWGRHSKAGYFYLLRQKQSKEPTYFRGKGFQRESLESQLNRALSSESDKKILERMKGKKKK